MEQVRTTGRPIRCAPSHRSPTTASPGYAPPDFFPAAHLTPAGLLLRFQKPSRYRMLQGAKRGARKTTQRIDSRCRCDGYGLGAKPVICTDSDREPGQALRRSTELQDARRAATSGRQCKNEPTRREPNVCASGGLCPHARAHTHTYPHIPTHARSKTGRLQARRCTRLGSTSCEPQAALVTRSQSEATADSPEWQGGVSDRVP